MKKCIFLISLFPLFTSAQLQSNEAANQKSVSVSAAGYEISGSTTGFPDGAVVDLINGNTRNPEASTSISNGKFTFSGKLDFPDFKLLSFEKSQEIIPIFLDNSKITVEVTKGQLDKAVISGSKSNDDFMEYSRITKPYEQFFAPEAKVDSAGAKICADLLQKYVTKNPGSYISPLAIFRINQLNANGEQMEKLFNKLNPEIQNSPIGNYVAQQIMEGKKNPMGKVIPDFEQADVNGNMVSIKSLRGKYVLIDFWASWCGPCRGENPNVLAAYKKYKNKNFTVLGISLDKAKEAWLKAIKDDGLVWQQLSDLKFWENEVAKQFGIQSIPQNFLIDPNGIVIGKNLRGEALEEKLASILK